MTQWNEQLDALTAYRAEHGTVDVPQNYVTPTGFGLGNWLMSCLHHQRMGELPPELESALAAAGVDFRRRRRNETLWDEWVAALATYRREHGSVDVPRRYITPDGRKLGQWVSQRRADYRAGKLSAERTRVLREMGVEFDAQPHRGRLPTGVFWQDYWLSAVVEYRRRHGTANVPSHYVTADGHALGFWLKRCRRAHREGKLPAALVERLTELGVDLTYGARPGLGRPWEDWLARVERYRRKHGTANVPRRHVTAEGRALGEWLEQRRLDYQAGLLSDEHARQLAALGVDFDPDAMRWNTWLRDLARFRDEHGHANVPSFYRTPAGRGLGAWLKGQRRNFRAGKLTDDQVASLLGLGVNLNPQAVAHRLPRPRTETGKPANPEAPEGRSESR
jgi:hypothetical protein